jgi:hypothetical protein
MASPGLRAVRLVLAAALVAGCGGHAPGGGTDGGRDGAAQEVETIVVAPDAGDDAAAAQDTADDELADAAVDAVPDEAEDAPDAAEAGADAPEAGADASLDVSPVETKPEVARDVAPHEVAPPHDTRPKYLGTYAAATNDAFANATVAADGSIYLAGAFSQQTDFDPGPGKDLRMPEGDSDVFITKLGADGGYLWTLTIGGPSSQTTATTLAVSDTALVVAGTYSGGVDFDPGAGTQDHLASASLTGFVLRLTPAGAFVWVSTLGGTSACAPASVALDADGSVYAAGAFSGFCDFDPGPGQDQRSGKGAQDGFLLKLAAADGAEVWAKTFDGDNMCRSMLESVATSSDGTIWTTGLLGETCSLAGQAAPVGSGAMAAAIAAFTPDGTPGGLWSIPGGDAVAVAASPDGFIYVGGSIAGVSMTDFDPGPGVANRMVSPGASDPTGFVVKLGPGAAFQWVQTTSRISTTALGATDDGGVIVVGQPVSDAAQTTAFTVTKRDADSRSPWGIMLPGTGSVATGVSAGRATFVVTGFTDTGGVMDLDPGPGVDSVLGGSTFVSRFSF